MIKHQVAGASEKKTIKLQEKIKLLYYAKKTNKDLGCIKLADVFTVRKTVNQLF